LVKPANIPTPYFPASSIFSYFTTVGVRVNVDAGCPNFSII
jgi:hypothetical protein